MADYPFVIFKVLKKSENIYRNIRGNPNKIYWDMSAETRDANHISLWFGLFSGSKYVWTIGLLEPWLISRWIDQKLASWTNGIQIILYYLLVNVFEYDCYIRLFLFDSSVFSRFILWSDTLLEKYNTKARFGFSLHLWLIQKSPLRKWPGSWNVKQSFSKWQFWSQWPRLQKSSWNAAGLFNT